MSHFGLYIYLNACIITIFFTVFSALFSDPVSE